MTSSLLTLMLLAGAAPCVNCGPNSGAWSPYYCPHRHVDDCPGREVYAQTSPHRHYPPRTAWMYRYTYKYGIHYSRPTDYRLLYDFPWYARGDDLPQRPAAWESEVESGGWEPTETVIEPPAKLRQQTPPPPPPATNSPVPDRTNTTSEEKRPSTARAVLPSSRLLR